MTNIITTNNDVITVIRHRERLNERTSRTTDDAIVRSASNDTKMQKLAEMTNFNRKDINYNLLITNRISTKSLPTICLG